MGRLAGGRGRTVARWRAAVPGVAGIPRPRVVAALLAGRGVHRLALYGAGIGLLVLWGPTEFAEYAAATGAVGWLTVLLASGPEKATLALVPRPDGAPLERLFMLLAVAPFLALVAGWLVLLAADPSATATRYAAAAALTCGIGSTGGLVALYRLRRAPYVDVTAFLGIAAAHGAVVVLVAVAGLGVHAVLAVLVGAVGLINTALVAALVPRLPRRTPGRRASLAALRATAMLSAGELLGTVSVSVLFAWFAAAGDAEQTSLFYVLVAFSTVLSVGWAYLLRLAQPPLVGWLVRFGAGAGWRLARRVVDGVLVVGVPAVAALAAAAALAGPATWLLVLVVALEVGLVASTAAAAVVLENIDAPGRRWSATAALTQLVAVAVAGWWLVPAAGALGAFGALITGELLRAAVLRGFIARAGTHPTGAATHPTRATTHPTGAATHPTGATAHPTRATTHPTGEQA